MAVGDNGTIITSPDGYNWTGRSFGVFPYLRGVAYASGEYAAVGDGGTILISSDAIAWTQIPSVTGNSLHGIAGDSSWTRDGVPQFLAVGDSGTAVACANGTNWSVVSLGTTNSLYGLVYDSASGSYIVAGNQGTIIYAWDSGSFTVPQFSVGTTNNLYAVASDQYGTLGVVGDLNNFSSRPSTDGILYSLDDGDDWAEDEITTTWFPSSEFILHGVAYGPSGFIAVGDTGYTLEYEYPGVVFTSANGANWNELPNSTSENRLYSCTYGNGLYVLVGDAGGIVVSSNLVNWTETTGYHRSAITAIACSGNLCIASAMPIFREDSSFPDFTALVSTNGLNWTVSSTNTPAMADLTGAGGQFVGVGENAIYATTDGYNWENTLSFSNALHGVHYLNGQFIAVGDNGSILESVDGTNWNNLSIVTSGSLSGVAFGNGVYAAAGSVAATSPDGLTWSLSSSNPPAFISRIVYGRGLFVAAGYAGPSYSPIAKILSSQDGMNWQVRFTLSAAGSAMTGVDYSGGTFLATLNTGAIFASQDGINWSRTTFNLPLVDNDSFALYYNLNNLSLSYLGYYTTVRAYRGTFLTAGLDGILVQSGNTWAPTALNMPQLQSNGFAFSYNQQIDVPYNIQTSTDLVNWDSVYSGAGTGQVTNYVYTTITDFPTRFFRIVSP